MNETNGTQSRWQEPVPCPATTLQLTGPILPAGEPRREDVEAAALLRAFSSGNAALLTAQADLDEAAIQVVERFYTAEAAIDEVTQYAGRDRIAHAVEADRAVAEQDRRDGPERQRRRVLPRWSIGIVLLIAAFFDAAFVANVVQRIFGVDRTDPVYWLAYLLGIGMALSLFVAGHRLAEHLFRHRQRATRSRRRERNNPGLALRRLFWDWRSTEQTRREDDLPWDRLFWPSLFTLAILGILGAGAYVRATQADSFARLADYQPVFVGLLLLLSIATIAVKVLSHNPYADVADEARKEVTQAERRSKSLLGVARGEVVTHNAAWNTLNSAIVSAEGEAARVVEEECARILDERGHRGIAGPFRLPLTALKWPQGGEEPPVHPVMPALRLDILRNAKGVLITYSPEKLRTALGRAVASVHQQFRAPAERSERGEHQLHHRADDQQTGQRPVGDSGPA
ncbi:MAG TPA: hypothetical protein VN408_18685 [Actinoplanes sp.]|nr:hypothetical protein [Actinoplanes sp.]